MTLTRQVTAVIGDLASLFGCVIGLPDSITAITIVALGTSLPDTFASRTAAVSDPTADAAVGNVTGSNAVNVFLGLGLPWLIGALYWASKGQTACASGLDNDLPYEACLSYCTMAAHCTKCKCKACHVCKAAQPPARKRLGPEGCLPPLLRLSSVCHYPALFRLFRL